MSITNLINLDEIRANVLEQFSTLMQTQTALHNFRETITELTTDVLTEISLLFEDRSNKITPTQKKAQLLERNKRLCHTLALLRTEEEKKWLRGNAETQNALLNINKISASLTDAIQKLKYYSTHDPVTHLHNRRYFDSILDYEISRSERLQHQFTLLFIDIDDFKKINDTYGHPIGDSVLLKIANTFTSSLRKHDIISRIAGDEFAIILPKTDSNTGHLIAEKIRCAVSQIQFDDLRGHHFQCTISTGIVHYPEDAQIMHDLMSAVDAALYRAKQMGKNAISKKNPESNTTKNKIPTKEKEEQLNSVREKEYYFSHYDSLTQLPNRDYFIDILRHAYKKANRHNKKMAVIILCIDDFRYVNNQLGHEIGNKLLIIVAKKLRHLINEQGIIARLAGDEFGIILEDIHSPGEAHGVITRYLSLFTSPILIDQHEVKISITSGVSIFPDCGENIEDLLQFVFNALHDAKKTKKGSFLFFNSEINQKMLRRHEIVSALSNALDQNEFSLVYQPQVLLATKEIIGIEALIRWDCKTLGMISPDEFIPIAEETGWINPIGNWVLSQAIADYQKMIKTLKYEIKLSINASAIQLTDFSFEKTIRAIMKKKLISHGNLIIEITETAFMKNPIDLQNLIANMSKFGVCFSLDDFGTGYSSMTHLKTLPISSIKIDKSFIGEMVQKKNDEAIVKNIISLGHSLNLLVIAEGVETSEQINILKKQNCHAVQGYYFSKPVIIDNLIHFIQQK